LRRVASQEAGRSPTDRRRLSRREILNYAWLASLGILAADIAYVSLRYAVPRSRPGEFGGVIDVGAVSDLPYPGSAPLSFPDGRFWLVHTESGLLALHKVCTHLDCMLNWNEPQRRFVCPCHGSQFARDGAYELGPAPRSLDRFVVQVVSRDGQVLAESDPVTGAPLAVVEWPAGDKDSVVSLYGADALVRVDTGRKIPGSSAIAT
jgi:cytochrome b6-f complex iron-sulfur subunit